MKKKVEDLTVKELEKYYSKKTGCIPDCIAIYWYDVRFMRIAEDRNQDKVQFYLMKNDEIEVLDNFSEFTTIKKVLNLIKEKGVDVGYLKTCKTLEEYNENCWNDDEDYNKKLTEAEFDFLKRWIDGKN